MSEPLHILYRPKTLDELVGNDAAKSTVASFLARDIKDMPHSWLFSGPSGTGKTTLARIMANELGCSPLDFQEYNSSSMRGIDTIRELEQKCKLAPMHGKIKIYLWDECHQITGAAQDAALKLLEDAPKNVFFFLSTTNPEKLKKAVRTRCTDVVLRSLNSRDILKLLKWICESEEKNIDSEILKKIAVSCDGSSREAVKMLDSIFDVKDKEHALGVIENTYSAEGSLIELCRALNKGEPWKNISAIIQNMDAEPEAIRRSVLSYFTKVLLDQDNVRVAEILEQFESNYYDSGKAGLVLSCFAVTKL